MLSNKEIDVNKLFQPYIFKGRVKKYILFRIQKTLTNFVRLFCCWLSIVRDSAKSC